MTRILLAEPLDADAERRLARAGEVVRAPDARPETLRRLIADCDAVVARTHTPIDAGLLAAAPRLRVIGVAGVGTDRVDLAAAGRHGVTVLSTPAAASDAVAELTVGFMLLLQRPVPRLAQAYREGRFREARAAPHGRELRGLTVGILGMGRIGSRVGRICAAGIGARVLYHDIAPVGPFDFPATAVDAETLWAESDILTLHVPLTEATRGLVNRETLGRLRPTALLINTARGAVVDTPALVEALRAGRLAAAALDVTDPEPLPTDHALLADERCIVTPHIASRTHEGLRRMHAIVDDVAAFLRREE